MTLTKIKCVVVDDGDVGKTSMILRYITGNFPHGDTLPNVAEPNTVNVTVDGKSVTLEVWDTDGSENGDRDRPKSYPGTDVFLICFSVWSVVSYDNVKSKWWPEVQHHRPGVP